MKTSEARNKIRQWFKKERREENIVEGRAELEREFRRNGIDLTDEELKSCLELIGPPSELHFGGRRLCSHWLRRHPALEVMPKLKGGIYQIPQAGGAGGASQATA